MNEIIERTLSEQIVDASPEHISVVGRDYCYKQVNFSYEIVHSVSRENIIGRSVADFLGTEIFESLIKAKLDKCFAGETIHFNAWFEFKNAGRRYMNVNYVPLKNSNGYEIILNDFYKHVFPNFI